MYSTYFGGDDLDYCSGIAIDSAGNGYVTGSTYSFNFPSANPVQFAAGGSADAFLAKLTDLGSALVYSTYLGGSGEDNALGIAVDPGGNAYVTGFTYSTDFPLVDPLVGILSDVDGNAFIAKLKSTGIGFAYSTYLGGRRSNNSFGDDFGIAIAVDSAGNAFVTGHTSSDQFPTTPAAFQPTTHGAPEAFVSKLSLFDVCLQDDSSGNSLQVNSATGDYQFTVCNGVTLSGTGVITRRGCLITLQVNGPDRRLLARIDTCMKSGTASMQVFSQGTTFTILDRSTSNNTCVCAGG